MPDYDAFLLVSFGGPEGPDDVMPFLENVTRGRGIPAGRLAAVAEHYYAVGGVSPINRQCRDLLAAIGKDFAAAGLDLPIYWGNRNWDPYLTGTVAEMAAAGIRRALAFVTSAYGSYSSCRQYRDDIEQARAEAGPGAPEIEKLRHFYNHPGFIEPFADATLAALQALPPDVRGQAPLVFTAHSVPEAMAAASGPPPGGQYPAQLAEAARLVADRVNAGRLARRRIRGGWSTRAAAGRPRSPGSARTSVTTWRSWRPMAPQAPCSSRSASSPTTWRSSTTWTSRRQGPRSGSACPWPARRPREPTPASSR